MPPEFWPDVVRTAVFGAYSLVVGTTVGVIWTYMKQRQHARLHGISHGGLLPNHVILLGIALIGAETECVWQSYVRVGEPFTPYSWINLVLFGITIWGLWLVMAYEWRRYKVHKQGVNV